MHSNVGMLLVVSSFLTWSQPALPQVESPPASIIHVEITGLRNDRGKVLCALYSSPEGFPKDSEKATARVSSAIAQGHAVCEFPGVTPGTYAVSVFHDENSNGKLDTNFMESPEKEWGHRTTPKVISGLRNFTTPRSIFRAVVSI